jgi:hypothetical protein
MHSEVHRKLYASSNIVRVIKSRRMRWAGHAARMGDMRDAYNFGRKTLKAGDNSEELGVDGTLC